MSNSIQKEKSSLPGKIWRWWKKLFLLRILILVILVGVGLNYEKSSAHADSLRYPPPGQVVDINGHSMHVFGTGVGKQTVVFSAGWGIPCPYAEYYPLYSELSKSVRTVVYDRPGYGWSSVTDAPRDIDTITKEMHELLEKSGEKPPYILIGHSMGSLEVLRFAQLYPGEVQGIVLLDGGNPNFYAITVLEEETKSPLWLVSLLNKTGVFRYAFERSPEFTRAVYIQRNGFSLVPDDLKELDRVMYLKNMMNQNKEEEWKQIKSNAATVEASGSIGNIPLVILTSESEAENPEWKESQEALMNWSSVSRQKILAGTNHNMQQYAPDRINEEILSLLKSL